MIIYVIFVLILFYHNFKKLSKIKHIYDKELILIKLKALAQGLNSLFFIVRELLLGLFVIYSVNMGALFLKIENDFFGLIPSLKSILRGILLE